MMALLPYEQMVSTQGDGVVNVVQAAVKWPKFLLLQVRLCLDKNQQTVK